MPNYWVKCYRCGKTFAIGSYFDYVYKIKNYDTGGHKYFCSYSCLRAFEKQQEHERKAAREKK